jgi:hypothetical protein
MTQASMMTQAGVGITLEPWHELIVITHTNAVGGRMPIPFTVEECEELAALLLIQVQEAKEAFGG